MSLQFLRLLKSSYNPTLFKRPNFGVSPPCAHSLDPRDLARIVIVHKSRSVLAGRFKSLLLNCPGSGLQIQTRGLQHGSSYDQVSATPFVGLILSPVPTQRMTLRSALN